MEEAEKEVEYQKKKCRKENKFLFFLCLIEILIVVGIFPFTIKSLPSSSSINPIYPAVLALLTVLAFIIQFFCTNKLKPNIKYLTRVKLIEILPLIDKALDVKYFSCFTLEYTVNSDPNDMVKSFPLAGFTIRKSTIVKRVTIDVDNFLILDPY
jgi:hypothetical protein